MFLHTCMYESKAKLQWMSKNRRSRTNGTTDHRQMVAGCGAIRKE
jgi:hypothetical protein